MKSIRNCSAWLAAGALKPCRILVPGCGSGYEVAALAKAGFDVTGLDFAPVAIARTRQLLEAANLKAELVEADALTWRPARAYDAIYEQTCLCALYPDDWRAYADQLYEWIRPGGRLFALFVQMLRPGAADGADPGAALPLRHQWHARAVSRGSAGPGQSRPIRARRTRWSSRKLL